jgi:cobalt-zinc-cadmium efflux system outer membrane protein
LPGFFSRFGARLTRVCCNTPLNKLEIFARLAGDAHRQEVSGTKKNEALQPEKSVESAHSEKSNSFRDVVSACCWHKLAHFNPSRCRMKTIGWRLSLSAALLAGCKSPSANRPLAQEPPAASTPAANAPVVPITRLPPTVPFTDVRLVSAIEPLPGEVRRPGASTAELIAPAPPMPSSSTPAPGMPQPTFASAIPLQLSLFDAVETALLQNPDLTTLRQTEGVSVGALGVARTYPFNPFVQIQATPFQDAINAGPGTTYHYVLVMQTLQLAHQQRHREDIGMAALNTVRWNILQAELLNVAQTERLYFMALYQRGLRDLARASASLNDQLLAISERQLNAGQASAADVAIIRLDDRSTNTQARLAEANYQTALLDLRRHLNVPLDSPLEVTGDLARWQWSAASPETLLRMKCPESSVSPVVDPRAAVTDLVSSRPDVMAARSDMAMAQSTANLASASRVPDLQIGPYYQRTESGTSFYGFRAQMDMPIFNTGVPLLRQRQAEVRQRQVAWEQLRARATIEAQAAIDRYERARQLAIQSSGDFSVSLPVELQKLEQQFKAGEVDVVRIFTARTSMIQNRRAHLDTLNELAQAAAQLTAATAIPPQAVVSVAP